MTLYDIVYTGENTFLNIEKFVEGFIESRIEKEPCYLLNNGSFCPYVDSYMLSIIERTATSEETRKAYLVFFDSISGNRFFAAISFYLFKLFSFILFSILPSIALFFSPGTMVFSLKFGVSICALLILIIATRVRAEEQTVLEADIITNGNSSNYEFFILNFKKRITSLLYLPENSVTLAVGGNTKLYNGSFSALGGISSGRNNSGAAINEASLWYLYFTKFLNKVNYTTFGVFSHSLNSSDWWLWFKHQFNLPIGSRYGIGFREDTITNPEGCKITYGPVLKFKWNSLTTHLHYRMGGKENILLFRTEVPIY